MNGRGDEKLIEPRAAALRSEKRTHPKSAHVLGGIANSPGEQPNPRGCPEVSGLRIAAPGELCSSDRVSATVELDAPADAHGAVVWLSGAAGLRVPQNVWVEPGAQSASFTVEVVGQHGARSALPIRASRANSAMADVRVRPPNLTGIGVSARAIGLQRIDIGDGSPVLGGTSLEVRPTLDCSQQLDGQPFQVRICTAQGVCAQGETRLNPWVSIETPFVEADTDATITASYLGRSRSQRIRLLASRVRAVVFDQVSVTTGIESSSLSATIRLESPAPPQGEVIELEYTSGLSGPALVTVPGGKADTTVSVRAAQVETGDCTPASTWLRALSATDRSRYGSEPSAFARSRYGELLIKQPCSHRVEAVSGFREDHRVSAIVEPLVPVVLDRRLHPSLSGELMGDTLQACAQHPERCAALGR